MSAATVYGASTVRRKRSTLAELGALEAAIINAVEADKPVTLRGVFYRVVSAGAVEKTENGYRRVARELLKLRRTAVVEYGDITDGTREIWSWRTWDSTADALEDTARTYRRALWSDQDTAVLLFTEKDAISGVIRPVASRWDVPTGVLRGYASESFTWTVSLYISGIMRAGKRPVVYQLGDHDPSGVSAWVSFTAGIGRFLESFGDCAAECCVQFERLAVLPHQIDAWSLPTRPTKSSDPRAANFDGQSVEVDAIPAEQLRELIESAITRHVDPRQLAITQAAERTEQRILAQLARSHRGTP